MYDIYLNKIKDKYNYSDNVMKALRLCLESMLNEFGQNNYKEILNVFEKVKIFEVEEMTKVNIDDIESKIMHNENNFIEEEKQENMYGTNELPGAFYSYGTIYDENMNVTGEKRWIVLKTNEDKYTNMFGTNINVPYLLHELNHAYAMQKAEYFKNGNIIKSKHGMLEEKIEYQKQDKIHKKELESKDIILEEMINEMYTQRELTTMLNKSNYNEVKNDLNSIGHVSTSYNEVLITLASTFEKAIGKENLNNYRLNNDIIIKDKFNEIANNSEIAKKYLNGSNPWEYFSNKCFEMFNVITTKRYSMKIEDYQKEMQKLMAEAGAPLYAYMEQTKQVDLNRYEELRNTLIPSEELETNYTK